MSEFPLIQRRQKLLSIYQAALRRVNGEQAVGDYLDAQPLSGEWAVIAIGKAATAMAMGAQQHLGDSLLCGLIVTKYGYADRPLKSGTWQVFESGHPLPDKSSLAAGEALLRFLEQLPEGIPLLFLLSGGASALVEALPEGMDLRALERVNEWLLASGLAIGEMNTIRKRLSYIKGGRLAQHLHGRRCVQLLISDVPGDDPATIGSGPLYPCPESELPDSLPDWLMALLENSTPVSGSGDPSFASVETHIIASNDLARQAAEHEAKAMGLAVCNHPGHFQGHAETLASEFVTELNASEPGVYLWGGESSVKLPLNPGRGGRNQHLALVAARLLAGDEQCLLLAAGTDGGDGPTSDAGALIDGLTITRGEEEGLSAEEALRTADSGSFLEASGDLVETGPTGTNVMDMVIAWRWNAD